MSTPDMLDEYEDAERERYLSRLDIQVQRIGAIHHGIDGSDEYLLVRSNVDDITPSDVMEILLPRYYKDCNGPGQYFCNSILAVQSTSANEVIATVQHRYDV